MRHDNALNSVMCGKPAQRASKCAHGLVVSGIRCTTSRACGTLSQTAISSAEPTLTVTFGLRQPGPLDLGKLYGPRSGVAVQDLPESAGLWRHQRELEHALKTLPCPAAVREQL